MFTVLRDAPFRTLVLLNLLVCLVFTAPWIGLPLTMADQGLSASSYGAVISVNGVVIVGFQLLVNKLTDKRSPSSSSSSPPSSSPSAPAPPPSPGPPSPSPRPWSSGPSAR